MDSDEGTPQYYFRRMTELIGELGSPEKEVEKEAVDLLFCINDPGKVKVGLLVEGLQNRKPQVRRNSADVLSVVGNNSIKEPAIKRLRYEKDELTRALLCEALGKFCGLEVIEVLEKERVKAKKAGETNLVKAVDEAIAKIRERDNVEKEKIKAEEERRRPIEEARIRAAEEERRISIEKAPSLVNAIDKSIAGIKEREGAEKAKIKAEEERRRCIEEATIRYERRAKRTIEENMLVKKEKEGEREQARQTIEGILGQGYIQKTKDEDSEFMRKAAELRRRIDRAISGEYEPKQKRRKVRRS